MPHACRRDLRPRWPKRETASVTRCARRDSNPRPSAPEAAPASDHQRWPLSFQALTRVARRPAPASDGPVVTTVVTAGRPESERWLERERARRRDAAASTRTLVERAEAAGQLAAAIDLGRRSTRLAPLDEAVVQRLIALLDGVGDRAVGARTFE